MATSVVTLLRSLQGIEVGPNEAPLLVIDDEGNWIGFTKEQTPEKTATAATKGLTLHDSSYLYRLMTQKIVLVGRRFH